MRLIRGMKLLVLLKVSHWCADKAGDIFDKIDIEKRVGPKPWLRWEPSK